MNKFVARLSVAALSTALLTVSSCIDHDYDLKEDNIDLKVTLGGDLLTLPASSVQRITLSQILDLDPTSSIKEIKEDDVNKYGLETGDYVLLQTGHSDPADFSVKRVSINEMEPSETKTSLDKFIGVSGLEVTNHATTVNEINLSNDDVTPELKALSSAKVNLRIDFTVGFESHNFSGNAYIKAGYKAIFNEGWTVEPAGDSKDYLRNLNNHTIEFTKDCAIAPNTSFRAEIVLTEVNLDPAVVGQNQGLYEPGKFRLVNDVTSEGNIAIRSSDLAHGEEADLTLLTTTSVVPGAEILSVTGIVDPEINVDPTTFSISDIPDFLSDEGNSLDIANPRIAFTIENDSPLPLTVDGQLTPYVNGVAGTDVKVGALYGTKPIKVAPMSTSVFTISREAIDANDPNNIVVPDLADIIKTIPDEISFHNINCKAVLETATYELGHTYRFNAEYEAIIPLAFGPDMKLVYSHEETNWDEDLSKYNFKEVEVSLSATSTLPLEMKPEAIALDRNGNELNTVKATVRGTIAPCASVAQPVKSEISVILTSDGENIGGLDGVRIVFTACSAEGVYDVNLNSGQSLLLEDIKVAVRGGVTIDLRDDK